MHARCLLNPNPNANHRRLAPQVVEVDADGLEQERGTKAPALLCETALLQEQDDSFAFVQRSYRCAAGGACG